MQCENKCVHGINQILCSNISQELFVQKIATSFITNCVPKPRNQTRFVTENSIISA